MFGFKDQMTMSWLLGREISQVAIGQEELTFTFFPGGAMVVPGGWELLDPAGAVVDRRRPHAERTEYRIHRLLGSEVTEVTVESEGRLAIALASGWRLVLLDDGTPFEAVRMDAVDKAGLLS